jgi:hypothetical protein
MKKDKLYRQIDVFDKKTEGLINEIELDSFDLELMKTRFNVSQDDYLMYNPYEIDSSKIDLFSNIKFDFKKYDYYLACYRGLTKNELEILMINKFCKPDRRERLIGLLKTNRGKLCLSHFDSFDLSLFDSLNKNEKEIIKEKAGKYGINQVYIMSENSQFDRKIMYLNDYLDSILFSVSSSLTIFGDAKFVFYDGEGKNNRLISK